MEFQRITASLGSQEVSAIYFGLTYGPRYGLHSASIRRIHFMTSCQGSSPRA